MAQSYDLYCSPCGNKEIDKNAKKWCTNCNEGLCEDCEMLHRKTKMSRDHKLISIHDYEKIAQLSINQICQSHSKKLDLYCKIHHSVLCLACASEKHNSCSEIIPLVDAAREANPSTLLIHLEESISDVLKNIQNVLQNQQKDANNFSIEETKVKTIIKGIRTKINTHLDEIEESLILELTAKCDKYKYENNIILKKLENAKTIIIQLQKQSKEMKQYASGLQVFLGTRQNIKKLLETINIVTTECSNLKSYNIQLQIHPCINSFLSEVDRFGDVSVRLKETKLLLLQSNTDRAQMHVLPPVINCVSCVRATLMKNFKVKPETSEMLITGCTILPDGQLLITDYYRKRQLMQYTHDGTHVRDILVSSQPYDITVIDSDRVAVSYGGSKYIEYINIKLKCVEKKIDTFNKTRGLSYQDGKMYVIVYGCGILVLDMSGNVVDTLKINVDCVYHITTATDRIYYSQYSKHMVVCCDMMGNQLWEFTSDSLKGPSCLTVDSNNTLFVAERISNNVTIIPRNGKTCKVLLTASDGLICPMAIYYEKDQGLFLICNETEAFLYKMT